jgi:hypothetical protein
MRLRFFVALGVLLSLALAPVAAQTGAKPTKANPAADAKRWTPLRTVDGQPDLQGTWDFRTVTPLERPSQFANKEVLTDEEAVEFARQRVEASDVDANRDKTARGLVNGAPATQDVASAYNDFWYDRGTKVVSTNRTSLVVDPPDGRIPQLTPEARARLSAMDAARERPAAGPEDRGIGERCILGFNSGPPINPGGYNQNVQIFQTRDHVVIYNEMVHNARIVPLDSRPFGNIRQWTGVSRGRWEGQTLVVETKNFSRNTNFRGSSANLHLIERFTRANADTLLYEFTVTDPTTWTRPWTVQIPMTRSDAHIFEYACHEGNYGMEGILSAARAVEKAAADAANKTSR